ncbi:hypothetical protein PanWU01x14_298040 [Parasponia andersonii]|uniref:Uncharacterized protein n=1 Tax=Parasponia andersonii TaxID=3476 RepID=A0A2P5AUS9_PARAD|nr:hypothetical protein PanWU01x14_298040 [Parasponia andersonii]
MAKIKGGKESRIIRVMKAPLRALIKARDFYIKSMTECSCRFDYGTVIGCPTAQATTLPRSFSSSSTKSTNSTDDYRILVKAASTNSLGNRIDLTDFVKKQQVQQQAIRKSPANNLPRSRSIGFGRIDEDKPCEFEDTVEVKTDAYPRSRSHALHKRTMF